MDDDTRARKKPRVSEGSRLYKPRTTAGSSKSKSKPKAKGERSRNAGKLATLMDITLDVFFEIVTHLRPVDLLQLCRVSKHFRSTFMSKSTRSLWVAARQNTTPLPLPEPLPGMSEPKLAALLFEHYCFACGVGRAVKVYYALGFRFCAACSKLNLQPGYMLRYKNHDLPDEQLTLVPMEIDCEEHEGPPETSLDYDRMLSKGFAAEYDEVIQQYRELKETKDCPESVQALGEFIKERHEYVASIAKRARAIYKWQQDSKRLNEQAIGQVQKRREASIREKLYSMGYTEDDLPSSTDWGFPGQDVWQSITVQPRELTPRIWKAAHGKLVTMLRDFKAWKEPRELIKRQEKREYELYLRYTSRMSDLVQDAEDGPYPSFRELKSFPEIRLMIKEDDTRIPIDQERFDEVAVPVMQQYKSSTRVALVKALRSDASQNTSVQDDVPDDESENILYNATSLFINPHLADDEDEYDEEYAPWRSEPKPLSFRELTDDLHGVYRREYGPTQVEYRLAPQIATARAVLKAVGLPENTRYEDVDKRIICLCHKAAFPQPASFSTLVNHISHEKRLHRQVHRFIELYQNINGDDGDSSIADTVYCDDHDFESGESFLRLLGPEDTYAPEGTGNNPDDNITSRCRSCSRIQSLSCIPVSLIGSMQELQRHVRAKHGREFNGDDMIRTRYRLGL